MCNIASLSRLPRATSGAIGAGIGRRSVLDGRRPTTYRRQGRASRAEHKAGRQPCASAQPRKSNPVIRVAHIKTPVFSAPCTAKPKVSSFATHTPYTTLLFLPFCFCFLDSRCDLYRYIHKNCLLLTFASSLRKYRQNHVISQDYKITHSALHCPSLFAFGLICLALTVMPSESTPRPAWPNRRSFHAAVPHRTSSRPVFGRFHSHADALADSA